MFNCYGMQLRAGLGVSTIIADMDFETYSEAGHVWNEVAQKWKPPRGASKTGLKTTGMAVYALHPSTEVLCFYYDLKDGRGPRGWKPGDPNPQELFDYLAAGYLIEAWNAGFEWWIWTHVCVPKYGWPLLPENQLRCAAAKARAFALPGHLGAAGDVLNVNAKKDKNGIKLIDRFSVPQNPTKTRPTLRIHVPGDPMEQELHNYCRQDIAAEGDNSARIPDLSPPELVTWQLDQRINRRGVQIDLTSANAAIDIIERAHGRYNAELYHLTGSAVSSASEVQALRAWLDSRGVTLSNLNSETVEEALTWSLDPDITRALQIRSLIGSASVKKLYAMINRASSTGRVYENFIYHSARTGRAAGDGVQFQNMPNKGPEVSFCHNCGKYCGLYKLECPRCANVISVIPTKTEWNEGAIAQAIEDINTRSLDYLEYTFGNAVDTIIGCLRSFITSAPGHDLICSDYSAIEAVVLACLAQEEWRLEVFRTHGRIYEASAATVMGLSLEDILAHKERTGQHHPARKIGKVAELASGYQGGLGGWKKFGADEFLSDEDIQRAVKAWRAANPYIVNFWYAVERAAVNAVLNPGIWFQYTSIEYFYDRDSDALYCRLPSKRLLTYHRPRLVAGKYGDQIAFEGWNTNPNNGPIGWITIHTYGGKLTENIVQAVARDILMHAIYNLETFGYPVVLHVHDEIVAEVPEGKGSVEAFEQIMSILPPWAQGWPIKAAGGWRAKRYRK